MEGKVVGMEFGMANCGCLNPGRRLRRRFELVECGILWR